MTKMLDVIHLAVAKSELSLCRALSKANHGGVNKERVWADSKTQGPDRDTHTHTHTYTQPTHAADTHTDVMKASPEGEGIACYIF